MTPVSCVSPRSCPHELSERINRPFLGRDAFFEPDQRKPARDLITSLLKSATGPATPEHPQGTIRPIDLNRFYSTRVAQSKRDNPVFSLDLLHKFFAFSNASLLYEFAGGDVAVTRTILLEERLPDGYESK